MQEIKGKLNTAYVYTDAIEQEAVNQIHAFLDSPAAEGGRIAIMPDVHAGAGCVVGFTQGLGSNPRVVPNLVGVDIGCGVAAVNLDTDKVDFDKFDKFLRATVPSGFNIHESDVSGLGSSEAFGDQLKEMIHHIWPELSHPQVMDRFNKVLCSVGTLGGGNHFIEINKDPDGNLWLVVHTGSRNFGLQIATYHQKVAEGLRGGKFGGLAYLDGQARDDYLVDLLFAQELAQHNRSLILTRLCEFFKKADVEDHIESVHNYISMPSPREDHPLRGDRPMGYVRKGAIEANLGQRVIVPLNMAEGCVIGRGKGNKDWNYSAPHGAGRVMSRTKAKASIDLDRFAKAMRDAGVWSSCVNEDTLDEAPMAYKRSGPILESLKETVDIELILKPIYNFKASEKSDRKHRKLSKQQIEKAMEETRAVVVDDLWDDDPGIPGRK